MKCIINLIGTWILGSIELSSIQQESRDEHWFWEDNGWTLAWEHGVHDERINKFSTLELPY